VCCVLDEYSRTVEIRDVETRPYHDKVRWITYSSQEDALQPLLPVFLRATEHVNVICCVLKEAKTIGGLDGKDIRLRRLVYPRDHICVKIGKRTEEGFILSLRKRLFSFYPHDTRRWVITLSFLESQRPCSRNSSHLLDHFRGLLSHST
jgi:hypothetical protein